MRDDHTITCHIGAFCFDVRQFGAFQFGAFHFDAVPVRRVSLWRASTSARFTLARSHFGAFHFGAFPNFVRIYGDPVPARFHFGAFHFGALPLRRVSLWRVSQFCTNLRWSGTCELFVCMFLFRGEELSTSFCAHVSFRSSVVSILRACFLSANKCFLR